MTGQRSLPRAGSLREAALCLRRSRGQGLRRL
jgi:hypothetical protein